MGELKQGISFEIKLDGARVNAHTPIAEFDIGYREYQQGPAAFNVVARDYEGKEVLGMGISEPLARRFAENLLEICDMERRDRPLIG